MVRMVRDVRASTVTVALGSVVRVVLEAARVRRSCDYSRLRAPALPEAPELRRRMSHSVNLTAIAGAQREHQVTAVTDVGKHTAGRGGRRGSTGAAIAAQHSQRSGSPSISRCSVKYAATCMSPPHL